jgi:NTE family protein
VIGGDWFGHYLDQQMPFAGIGNLEYVENAFTAVGMKVQQRIEDNNYIMFTASLAAHGDKFHNMLNSFMHGYSLSYAYNSIFGPLGASLGYASRTKELYFFINLGFVF